MLSINWSDVMSILELCKPYLIAFGIVAGLAILVSIACIKLSRTQKFLIRRESGIAVLLAFVIVANLLCTGPLSTILSLVSGNGAITEATSVEAEGVGEQIAAEGIVLLENEEQVLPLDESRKLNVFGWASTNPCYGGTGSGALSDAYEIVDVLSGLAQANIEYNTELSDFYKEYREERPAVGMWEQDWTLPEPPVENYSQDMLDHAKDFSETAMIVISRVGGEHIDLPQDVSTVNYTDNSEEYQDFPEGTSYLELSQSERNLLELVCDNFEDVIVVYNGANTLQMDFVNEYSQIKGVIWCPGTGQNGFNALGDILTGEVNPSGKTADTFVNDLQAALSWNNFGNFTYENMNEFQISKDDQFMPEALPTFVNYTEGIYVGYKFYETAADEGLIEYYDEVCYPFGYGLSYTTFTQDMSPVTENGDGTFSFDVTVTNTGEVPGKEVVEVYCNPPYTNGGIEKASVNLLEFEKTDMLQPGDSETISFTISEEDLASYDTYDKGAYVLEEGEYHISINSDSHNEIASEIYTVRETVVYDDGNARSTDLTSAVNQFDFAEGNVDYLSRADGFANYAEAAKGPTDFNMPEESKAGFVNNSNFEPEETDVQMPTTGADNGLTLAELRGVDYEDEKWDALLDQLTIDDMKELIALGGYQTAEAESVGKLQTTDCDGPASINNNFTGVGSIGFPSAVMIANTWNLDMALSFGRSIGKMADEMNVSGWYAPAMNIHRNAFAGRNFEYYSEDGFLSGKMAANAVAGAAENGVYAYIKHFALNDQETNRWSMLCTWANEQSIREIYLKPFEIAVKEGGASAVMSSYNYIGNQWAGACNALLNAVLREEWGFRGFVLTDYFAGFGYMDGMRSVYNGGDSCLANYDAGTNYIADTSTATTVAHMRQASKNILYTTVNSRAYEEENIQTGLMLWQIILIVVDVLFAAIVILLEVLIIRGYLKRKKVS